MASQPIGKGGRTNRLVSLTGSMHKRGMTPEAIEAPLLKENAQFNRPLPEEKVKAIAHDIPARHPNAADEGRANGFRLERLGDLLAKPEVPPHLSGRRVACARHGFCAGRKAKGWQEHTCQIALSCSCYREGIFWPYARHRAKLPAPRTASTVASKSTERVLVGEKPPRCSRPKCP